MDYKEKYEQALAKAKDMLNYKEVKQEDMEYLFPELVESEDEKIRKELIDFVKSRLAGFPQCEKYTAWLEKQGEKKPAEEYNITGIGSKNAQGKLGEMIKRKLEMEKQSEPADKVEPKFKAGDKIIGTISNIPYYITEACNGYYLTDVGSIIMFNAQDNFELFKQKPAWSEEDENRLSSVLFLLHEYKNYNFNKWLKSLKERVQLQPKQEWSEEDEEEANYIADFIENLIKKEKLVSKKTMIMEEMVDWLKSLRPQKRWKPSDKQMEMVDKIINVLSKMQLFGGRNALIDLKHDLKKLREE